MIVPQWNPAMIAASIAISLLGAFTSTQLMCQARMSLSFSSVLVWTFLASLTFGFCSIWCLHFVAMLACELDLPIGVDISFTIASSILAVFFTFAALASDLLWVKSQRDRRKQQQKLRRQQKAALRADELSHKQFTLPSIGSLTTLTPSGESGNRLSEVPPSTVHLDTAEMEDAELLGNDNQHLSSGSFLSPPTNGYDQHVRGAQGNKISMTVMPAISSAHDQDADLEPLLPAYAESSTGHSDSHRRDSSEPSTSRRSSSLMGSNSSSLGLGNFLNLAYRGTVPAKNAFIATGETLYHGFTSINVVKGFCWSLAITSMHYVGIFALHIPEGYSKFNAPLVVVSAVISWIVCIVGCILMPQMETHFSQQLLFSIVATSGVAAMHFTGMQATTFWSKTPPSDRRGYPPVLAIAVASIAITTCILANGLLAHTATVSRNKLAEIVWTRRKLWRTIAQKENAEAAAAARSDFIASASHEIRTPLHHLQGYSDLLSRTELTEEGKVLLCAIQRATKTLSLITNNVLDWSKLERETDATCRPVALDMRTVCESILVLLPNQDEDTEVEIMVVVKPEVPYSVFLDETYVHRILMNLLSNALKFTRSGYVSLSIGMKDENLIATVKDTGCGIPPSFLPQLFEPFKQAQTRAGSQRGTGLGLSIVKQLLFKMGGTIAVESRHPESGDVRPDEIGSTFTVTVPVQSSSISEPVSQPIIETRKIAIFDLGNSRSAAAFQESWKEFGWEVVMVESTAALSDLQLKYIWADVSLLDQNPTILHQLLHQNEYTVLVPYDSQSALDRLSGILTAPNFITLKKPLMWHTFEDRISLASRLSTGSSLRTVRFASTVDILDGSSQLPQSRSEDLEPELPNLESKNLTVLLVEDNPINQKLGTKMITSLGYNVLLAHNGAEAISQISLHDAVIDGILMDQSMPLKDGVTATKEIREMERDGRLSRRRPIIALTAVVNTESRILFKEAGADDFLSKPLSLNVLERTLELYLDVI